MLSKKLKFNEELFRIHNRTVIIDKMKDGKVSEIRNILLYILTFLAQKIILKLPYQTKNFLLIHTAETRKSNYTLFNNKY